MATVFKTYGEKLKDPRWQKKRTQVFLRDDYKCVKCDDTQNQLHVHHLKYTGEPWEAPLDDLVTLCEHCHIIVDKTPLDQLAIHKEKSLTDFRKVVVFVMLNGHFFIYNNIFTDELSAVIIGERIIPTMIEFIEKNKQK